MKTSFLIERASFALRKFRHAEACPAQGTEPEIISNKVTGDIAVGCQKCNRAINLTMTVKVEPALVDVSKIAQVKPRFKL